MVLAVLSVVTGWIVGSASADQLRIGRAADVGESGRAEAPAQVTAVDPAALAGDIAWTTAPPVGARARLTFDPARYRVAARAGADPLVIVGPAGVVIAADLEDPSNAALRRWGYLPFLLYAAGERAAGRTPVRFAAWPGAPVPHRGLTGAWLAVLALAGVTLLFGIPVRGFGIVNGTAS